MKLNETNIYAISSFAEYSYHQINMSCEYKIWRSILRLIINGGLSTGVFYSVNDITENRTRD